MLRNSFTALVLTLALAVPALAQHSFWLDGSGRVFTVDSYGRIAIDGHGTSWYPSRDALDLQVSAHGDAVYTDSYGKLRRNGSDLYYNWIRPHYFRLDREGNIYTVKDWVTQTIQRNGSDTGFAIEKGSGFVADDHGNLFYTSERTGNLCINGRDTGRPFERDDFVAGPDGGLWYVNSYPHQGNRHLLFRYDFRTGEHRHVALLGSREGFAFDLRGNLWIADNVWRITKNGHDTGWRSAGFRLDGAGNCYFQDSSGWIHRNGQNTGWMSRGMMNVAPNGDVVYVGDTFNAQLYKNGRALGIWLNQGKATPSKQTDAS